MDNEISNTYVEVSIANQHIWMYQDGELILSCDCITGDITDVEKWTYTGVYYIVKTKEDATLVGPDYYYEVKYWIEFDHAHANGFHDATWREDWEFGGETYIGNGSHGCINCQFDNVAILYNNLQLDEPIIIW